MNRQHLADLKQFARAEMARDLAARHGRKLRLPWDPDEPATEAAPADPEQIDTEALQALSGVELGD